MRDVVGILCALALALLLVRLLTGCCVLGPSPRTVAAHHCTEAKVAAVRECPTDAHELVCPAYKRALRECRVLTEAAEGMP